MITQLQIDSTSNIISTSGFSDNYFWPLCLIFTVFLFGIIWNFFIRKKVKVSVDHAESYVADVDGTDYTVLKVKVNNQLPTPINNLTFETEPAYKLVKGVSKSTKGQRIISGGSDTSIFPMLYDAVKDVIDPTKPQAVDAEHPIEGFVVVRNEHRIARVNKLIVKYRDKKVVIKIKQPLTIKNI